MEKKVAELTQMSEFVASAQSVSKEWVGPNVQRREQGLRIQPILPDDYIVQGRQMINFASSIEEPIKIVKAERCIEADVPVEIGNKLWLQVKDKKVALSNFIVKLERIVHRHSLNKMEICYQVAIRSDFGALTMEVPERHFLSLATILAHDHPAYRLETALQKRHEIFRSYLSQLVERAASQNVPEICAYDYSGWQVTELGGRHYFSALDKECTSTLSLVPIESLNREQVYEGLKFLNSLWLMGEHTAMVPMFLYKFVGPLAAPFKEALKPVSFILDICGPTGIGKTAVSRPYYGDFDPKLDIVNFTATASGIDRFVQLKHDGIALIDDLSSITDREAVRTLERVLRQFCDSNGRVTAARGGGITRIDMRCGIVLTSEGSLEGTRQSSQLRLLVVPVHGNSFEENLVPMLRADVLRRCSSGDYSLMDIGMSTFIRYVEKNYQGILQKIVSFRAEQLPVEFRRLQSSYEALSNIAEIVGAFFHDYGIYDSDTMSQNIRAWNEALKQVIFYNANLGKSADPVSDFLKVLVQRINQNLIRIADTRKTFAENTTDFCGFWEGEGLNKRLKLDPDRIYEDVITCYRKASMRFAFTKTEVLRKLADQGLSEAYQQKGTHASKTVKVIKINGNGLRFLVLDWPKVVEFLDK